MITAARRSITCIGILLVATAAIPATDTIPLAVLADFQKQLAAVPAFRATIKRKQGLRSVYRNARGSMQFSQSVGSRYEWKTPGHYLFLSSDTLLSGVDLRKKCGWQLRPSDSNGLEERRYQTDPLWRLMELCHIDRGRFSYRGNSGSLLFFTIADSIGRSRTISLDAEHLHCGIIERFNGEGVLTEKTVFTYNKKSAAPVLPSTIIITGRCGADLAVDTIRLRRQRITPAIEESSFSIPEGIRWNTGNRSGCSMQQQLDPSSGR